MSTRNSIVSLSSGSTKVETRLADIPSRASLSSHVSGQEGAMIPSSSSKDDDLLSSSSDEIEKMAMQTLEHLEESKPPSLNRFADHNGSRKSDVRQDDRLKKAEEPQANIQNEFGVCGWILTILSYLLIFITLPISACMCIKVVQEYERAVIFRLGRLMPGGAKGPGIFFIVPCIDTYRKVDLRVLSFEVPPQEILSKDSVTVAVDAVVYFRISNATISVTNVEDAARSTKLLAQTTLRNILGTKTLAEMLSDREAISHQMQTTLDEATEPWGVKVERVEVKDVRLPVQLQRAMAAEAEAAREARAKVIVAEGEQKASRALKEAAEVIAESPSALQLRYLQTLNSISAEKNSTIIFPFPIDLLSAFMQRPAPRVEEPPPLPKKIRSCCLYKYPEWVQGMAGEGKHPTQQPPQMCPSHQAGAFGPNTTITSGRAPLLSSFREAHHSAAVHAQMATTPMQLDPGSLSDSTRPSAWKEMRLQASGGAANSLLKKAIANRLRPIVSSDKQQHEPDRQSPPTDRDVPLKYESDSTASNDSNAQTAGTQLTPKPDEILSSDIGDGQGRSNSNAGNENQIQEGQKEPTESANPERGDRQMQERRKKPVESTTLGAELSQSQDRLKKPPEIVKSRSRLSAGAPRSQARPPNSGRDANATESRTGAVVGRERRQKKLSGHEWEQGAVPRERRGGVSERGPPSTHERTLPSPATHSKPNSPQNDRPRSPSFSPDPVARRLPQPSETSPQGTDSHVALNVLENQRRVRYKGRGRTEVNRRDSSFSESSRFSIASHKSVTFSDRVQLHEIERNELTSSEEDAAIMSDDEMSRRSHQCARRHIHFYRSEVKHEMVEDGVSRGDQEHTVGVGQGHRQMMNPDDDIEKSDEEEFLQGYPTGSQVSAAMEVLERSGSGSSDLSTIGEKHGSISERDPQRMVDVRSTAAQTTELFNNSYPKHNIEYHHLEDTAGVEGLPRSASGYFDEEEEEQEEEEEGEELEGEEGDESEEEAHQPYPHLLYFSRAADISSSAVRSPLHSRPDNVMEMSTYDNAAAHTQLDSQVFLEQAQYGQRWHSGSQIRLGAPQNAIPIEEAPSQLQEVTRARVSLPVDAAQAGARLEGRSTVEEQMRGEFLARFGAGRRAPVAEKDPCDPVHSMGSLDSVLSTDSRESVVSSVSIRKEAATHRNFKY